MAMVMVMKTGKDSVALLGKPADDVEVKEALRQFNVRLPPELDEPEGEDEEPDWYVWRPASPLGFEFGFQDEAHLRALDPALRGQSPLVLSQVYFYGQHEGVRPYQGELPFGLTLADSRAEVRAKLTGLEVQPRSHRRDVWDVRPHRIVSAHDAGGTVFDSLLVKLRLSDWPPLEPQPAPPLPTLKEIIALFGRPWHGAEMRAVFFPLGLDACGPDIARHRHADLRFQFGLQLYFFRDPTRDQDNPLKDKGAVFSAIKFYRSRYRDARAWAGELPFGITFDEAYPSLLRKVGRQPDSNNDHNLGGFALWHFPEFTLHVLYENVDNVVLTVSLFQPGAWTTVSD